MTSGMCIIHGLQLDESDYSNIIAAPFELNVYRQFINAMESLGYLNGLSYIEVSILNSNTHDANLVLTGCLYHSLSVHVYDYNIIRVHTRSKRGGASGLERRTGKQVVLGSNPAG